MSGRGRFGKYGEHKRIGRLRQAGAGRAPGAVFPGRLEDRRGRASGPAARITLRPAAALDADFIRELSETAFSRYGPYHRIIPGWCNSERTATVVAVAGKKAVGFAMVSLPVHLWPFPRTCELLAIAVAPANRRRGTAGLLLEEIVHMAEASGARALVLHTAVGNRAARKLFAKHGFRPLEVKKRFYPRGQDALLMCRVPG